MYMSHRPVAVVTLMSLGKENSMAEKVREFKGGPGARGRGPRPKVANPGKLFKRIMQYVMRNILFILQ